MARKMKHDDIALRTWLRLLGTTRKIEVHLSAKLKAAYGISGARLDVMSRLARVRTPVMMRDISNDLMVTSGNVTSLVDAMERDALVRRVRSKSDRRVIGIELTAKGRSLFNKAAKANTAWVNTTFAEMSSEKLEALHELVRELRASGLKVGIGG